MRLKRIAVKNFRSIKDISVELGNELAIVGGNGSGKSTVLRALERFFGQTTTVELDDFFGRTTENDIEIALTFSDFSKEESEHFEKKISNAEMTVVRVFEAAGGRTNGRYYGTSTQHSGFQAIRDAGGANPTRTAYSQVRDQGGVYASLPTVSRADQIPTALEQWEAEHPDQCEPGRDDGQFFGFTNVARGALNKFINFVFIPAVRDASMDALDSRGAVIAKLMELVVRSAVQQRREIREFQVKISEEYKALTDPERLTELSGLSGDLTDTIKLFYQEAAVALRWKPTEEFSLPLPTADVFLDDDGFEGPVDRKGHGLQRAFILTLLQHLAKAVAGEDQAKDTGSSGGESEGATAVPAPLTLPNLILAIEEPELYQHPTKQRHFAKVLSQLSSGELPGVARSTQVLFATHSSLFVSMDRFDEIALARREKRPELKHKCCKLTHSALSSIAQRLEAVYGKPVGTFTAEGLRARLHIIGSEVSEGFFADLVVLVEGVSDKAAILAAAELEGIDFGALGIAVLYVDGKSKLDRPAAIFTSLGIPTFVVWDCDMKDGVVSGADIVSNRALQGLMNVPNAEIGDARSIIGSGFACFETKLEAVLKAEIGQETYQQQCEAIKEQYGIQRNEDIEKAPFAMCELLKGAAKVGKRSGTLDKIVHAVVSMRESFAVSLEAQPEEAQ